MRFDHASGNLQLIWNTFLDFEAFTREADGDLNYFIEEWKEKMVRVQSAGCQYSELLLGLKLLEKVNLSSDSIKSIISKLGSSHSNSDSFLAQVVTNLQAEIERAINGSSVDDIDDTEKINQLGTNDFNQEISVELDIKRNLISCPRCPEKFFDACSFSKHYQEFHPNENQEKVLISKKDLKPDPDLLKYSECDKNFILKKDSEEHRTSNDDYLPLESFVQVWVGSPERSAENSKDDPLMSDEIKIEINSVIGFKSDINNIQTENESNDRVMTTFSDKFRCDICQREFTTVTNLRMHMASHKTSVDFTCYHCGKTNETNLALKNHVRKYHSNEPNYGIKKFPCKICSQQVAHAQKDKHMMKHFCDPFKCGICGKEFQDKNYLNYHMNNHRTTKDFMCSHSGMHFQNRNSLNDHKRNHHKKKENIHEETASEAVTESKQKSDSGNSQFNNLDKIEEIKKEGIDSTPTDDLPSENKVPCKTCGKFVAKTSMSNHNQLHLNNVFKCCICQKEFNLSIYLKAHMETHKKTKDHVCPHCSKSFKTKPNLRKHIKIVCRNEICEICGTQVALAQKAKHMIKHFRDPFKCDICGKEFQEKRRLNFHMENHRTTRDFMCSHCGKRFQNRATLYVHKSNHRRKERNKREETAKFPLEKEIKTAKDEISSENSCEISGENMEKVIKEKETIDQSLREEEGKIPLEISGKLIAKQEMIKHIKVHRLSVQSQCEICGKIVNDRKMKKHLETQCENTICSICQKQFKNPCDLKAHKESHNATNEYICSFCGKKYKTKRTLNKHINLHTKVQPLPCKFCDKIFYCYGTRRFHIRAHHTGEKPYKCDICDERFYISSRKVQHMRKHTGEKPFSCDKCGKNFTEASSLKKHVRTVHKEVKSSDI